MSFCVPPGVFSISQPATATIMTHRAARVMARRRIDFPSHLAFMLAPPVGSIGCLCGSSCSDSSTRGTVFLEVHDFCVNCKIVEVRIESARIPISARDDSAACSYRPSNDVLLAHSPASNTVSSPEAIPMALSALPNILCTRLHILTP